ncbi:conserved hypothetical protein [Candidatus Accumulibacter aalborgensis]|uniref:Uncharacterized protein n=1 Tax=Candidatus Accumulibacter aalborgensis TaxID=1860102 RepID=A0A1A8XPG2_9PROT|nr:hypothetical protein [Candidatus Accumulibacter aalborgensis]SBT07045.1 conserved hypothetical protein [Candidatus Accumulibacter aalborgensis]
MPVHKTTARIQATGELTITHLPFAPGTLVEVLVVGSERSAAEREQEWARLMQAVQALPQAETIIDEDIATEIDRRAVMRQALAAVTQAGTFASIDDASAWQRELRVDRAQPGRED